MAERPHLAWDLLGLGRNLQKLLYVPTGQFGTIETHACQPGLWGSWDREQDGSRATLLLISGLLPTLPPVS